MKLVLLKIGSFSVIEFIAETTKAIEQLEINKNKSINTIILKCFIDYQF